jgi:hypothetical protein
MPFQVTVVCGAPPAAARSEVVAVDDVGQRPHLPAQTGTELGPLAQQRDCKNNGSYKIFVAGDRGRRLLRWSAEQDSLAE